MLAKFWQIFDVKAELPVVFVVTDAVLEEAVAVKGASADIFWKF